MRIILSVLLVIALFSPALAIESEYLELVRKEIELTNYTLPIQVDRITTLEHVRLLEKDGKHYVVSKMIVDTDLKEISAQSLERARQNSIKSGCSDPAIVDYMNHGISMGGVFYSKLGHLLGEIEYSKEDCP